MNEKGFTVALHCLFGVLYLFIFIAFLKADVRGDLPVAILAELILVIIVHLVAVTVVKYIGGKFNKMQHC